MRLAITMRESHQFQTNNIRCYQYKYRKKAYNSIAKHKKGKVNNM